MPFFYVPGNHDMANAFEEKVWQEKFGRRYYHFRASRSCGAGLDPQRPVQQGRRSSALPVLSRAFA